MSNHLKKLPLSFYTRGNVVLIAKELLGKILVTNFNNQPTSGRIVETEAYAGELDKASHASKGKTERTAVMFGSGGRAYVYLCYGIHQMFNIVTAKKGVPHAILIRAIEPVEGKEIMIEEEEDFKVEEEEDFSDMDLYNDSASGGFDEEDDY